MSTAVPSESAVSRPRRLVDVDALFSLSRHPVVATADPASVGLQ
jgi:hypothetical protein